MARINMIKAAVSRRTSAHAPMDNVTTPYNPIRLLKGAPPGQERVNYYASELNIMGQHNRNKIRQISTICSKLNPMENMTIITTSTNQA